MEVPEEIDISGSEIPTYLDVTSINSTFLPNYSDEIGTSTPPPELFHGYSTAILTFASISCIIFIIVGVPGNLITIAALAKCKKVRNATAVFIINLSLSDLLFCCFNLPLATSTFMNRAWTHGDLLCRLFPLLRYGLVAVSLFTILAITINRYVMIGHPRIYPKIYQRKFLIVMVVGCWLFAFLPLIFTWSGHWGTFGLDTSIGSCSILPDKKGHSPKEFLFIIAFALPCLCIIICYARIFYIVRKTHESVIKSVGSIKIVHANSNMKITTSNAPLAEEEKLCYDEKKRQNNEILDDGAGDAEKQLLPKNNNISCGNVTTDTDNNRRTIMKRSKNNNNNRQNHKIYREQYSSNNASDDVSSQMYSIEASGGGGNASNISGGSYFSNSDACASNNENNIFCKTNNDNGNENERTKDGVVVSRTSSLYNRQRKFLTKLDQDEDLKFIDTSIESDLPPTLSNLRQNNASARKLSAQLSVRINEMNNFVINAATTTVDLHDDDKITNEFDSAMEYSSSTTTNNSSLATEQIYREIKDANKLSNSTQYLAVQIEPSSSSGIDIPYEQDTTTMNTTKTTCVPKKRSFVQTLRKSTRLAHRRRSMGNTSGASLMYPGRMTPKDRRLLKMILVIFVSFVICYLPITINKTFDSIAQNHFMNITGYLLIYLTTCINPIIYVVMSSEYRQAYKNLLMCRNGNVRQGKSEIQRNASPRA